ncbi:N-acetyltransferase [Tissierella pigra]|uniref:N-acetyltransferase n=1 Tax=Tissierella pigra TaxID=2607614 RepID=A0A6N7Y188_9FIRM|nr:N-acetyltransferase [Tissierella pigra]MSU02505.1 N-acetyltransferase [Tissierella pigra]
MIKILDISKMDDIMKIWLETNITAHDFISENYWRDNYDFVKKVLPESTVFVYEEENEVKGFVGIVEDSYIAGLFIAEEYQYRGIGSKLINKCKEYNSTLKLDVYGKNLKAINFYKKCGFKIIEERVNNETKEIEYSMMWNK